MTNTVFSKGRDGWQGETSVDLGIEGERNTRLVLEISTTKSSRGGIESRATVFAVGDHFKTHKFSFDGSGDFSKGLECNRSVRCTEKTIRSMHEDVLVRLSAIVEVAKAHYAAQAEQAAA